MREMPGTGKEQRRQGGRSWTMGRFRDIRALTDDELGRRLGFDQNLWNGSQTKAAGSTTASTPMARPAPASSRRPHCRRAGARRRGPAMHARADPDLDQLRVQVPAGRPRLCRDCRPCHPHAPVAAMDRGGSVQGHRGRAGELGRSQGQADRIRADGGERKRGFGRRGHAERARLLAKPQSEARPGLLGCSARPDRCRALGRPPRGDQRRGDAGADRLCERQQRHPVPDLSGMPTGDDRGRRL